MKKNIEVVEKKIEIKEISIKIGDKTITLSPDEAKTLKDELSKIFGDNRYYYPIYVAQPVQVIPVPQPYPYYPQIWCGGLGSAVGVSLMQSCGSNQALGVGNVQTSGYVQNI